MASWLVCSSQECSPSLSPGQGHFVVFLEKMFYSCSLHSLSISTLVHINGCKGLIRIHQGSGVGGGVELKYF